MTQIVLQVQGAEPRCFLLEIDVEAYNNPRYMVCSVWALSAFDALEQGIRGLRAEEQLIEVVRNAKIGRVALCAGGKPKPIAGDGGYLMADSCMHTRCAAGHLRIGSDIK